MTNVSLRAVAAQRISGEDRCRHMSSRRRASATRHARGCYRIMGAWPLDTTVNPGLCSLGQSDATERDRKRSDAGGCEPSKDRSLLKATCHVLQTRYLALRQTNSTCLGGLICRHHSGHASAATHLPPQFEEFGDLGSYDPSPYCDKSLSQESHTWAKIQIY